MGAVTAQKKRQIDLPDNGMITSADFEALPGVPRDWAWELFSGRLRLEYMPCLLWHSEVVALVMNYWRELGHRVGTEQYVADSGYMHGKSAVNNFVADGVVFKLGHRPAFRTATHEASELHAVVEAVSADSESRDAVEKLGVYAHLGVPNYWIIRQVAEDDEDGTISMYELVDGAYKLAGTRLVSQLADGDAGAQAPAE